MNMNDLDNFKQIDQSNMIGAINDLPDQLQRAWSLGQELALPKSKSIQRVIISGMGGSAIGADLLNAYAQPHLKLPLFVHRGYDLPAWAAGPETLVICCSHSGNTEETLSSFEGAQKNKAEILAITTGGKLAEAAEAAKHPVWHFDHQGQPRTAVGYSFGLLLALCARLDFLADPSAELESAVAAMQRQQEKLLPDIPDTQNSAKRMGGQFMGRWVTIFGAEIMAPVAQRWKAQLNENAKSQAAFEILPEADHNTIQGVVQPEDEFRATMNIFLQSSLNHPRNQLRTEKTRVAIMLEGQNTDSLRGRGPSRMAHMWTALHYGDYSSFYLAMGYQLDPTPVPMLVELKDSLSKEK
jgi:glucose/mannose-6-phosphate isomerase